MNNQILFFIAFAFLVSIIWEFAHAPLYDWKKAPLQDNPEFKIHRLSISILGDVLFLSLMFGLISLINQGVGWALDPGRLDYTLIIVLGLALAVFIEVKALFVLNQWSYSNLMPTLLGIGISPLVQLVVSFVIALELSKLAVG